jgi:hypothetical protein
VLPIRSIVATLQVRMLVADAVAHVAVTLTVVAVTVSTAAVELLDVLSVRVLPEVVLTTWPLAEPM